MTTRRLLLPMFFTVFIDLVGLGIIIPVLATILLTDNNPLMAGASLATRTITLGFLVATFPLAQFFGAPILGALSDRYGRKPILLIALVGTLLGYLLFAEGIHTNHLALLFISRFIDGFTGGNISIILSSIADVSDSERSKTQNFGIIGMAFGLGFVLGPYIGGKLSDPTLVQWFDYTTPFWFAAGLTVCNIILVALFFRETLVERLRTKLSFFAGFTHLKEAFRLPSLKVLFWVTFLIEFGFNFMTQFFQVFLIEKFAFTQSDIGDIFAYFSLWIAFTQGSITQPLAKLFAPYRVLRWSIVLLATTLMLLILPDRTYGLLIIIPFVALFQGLTQPNLTTLISQASGAHDQGKILGIKQSITSLGQAIPPIIAGFVVLFHLNLPIIVGSVAIALAWIILMAGYKVKS